MTKLRTGTNRGALAFESPEAVAAAAAADKIYRDGY